MTTTVFVCRECKHHRAVERFLDRETDVSVRTVGCQKVCQEPVCGLRIDGKIEWFGGLDKPKRQQALARFIDSSKRSVANLPGPLAEARAKNKASKSPR
jgi:hypothetical protein